MSATNTAGKTSRFADRKMPCATSSDHDAPSGTVYRRSGPTSALRPSTVTSMRCSAPGVTKSLRSNTESVKEVVWVPTVRPSTVTVARWLMAPKFRRVTWSAENMGTLTVFA